MNDPVPVAVFSDPDQRAQKRPWHVEVIDGPAVKVVFLRDSENLAVATIPEEIDARLIVAAVNAYDETAQVENDLRREWWLNHGHSYSEQYGDDGEMQCSACPADFKRQPISELRQAVLDARLEWAAAATWLTSHEHEVVEQPWHDGYTLRRCGATRGNQTCAWSEYVK